MANTALSIASRGKNVSSDVITHLSGTICCPLAGTSYRQPVHQIKATKNAKIGVVWRVRGLPRSSETSPLHRSHMTSYSTLIETMRLSCTVFEL